MVEKINIKQFDLANEKVVEPICLFCEIAEKYLMYVGEYYCQVPAAEDSEDHSLGWKDRYSFFKIKIKRDCLVSVELKWVENREIYKVEVEANGYPSSISFYFKTGKEAEEMFKKLDDYIFG